MIFDLVCQQNWSYGRRRIVQWQLQGSELASCGTTAVRMDHDYPHRRDTGRRSGTCPFFVQENNF